jgi:hypothetical protein
MMTAEKPERLVPDMRNVRYGEVLTVFSRDGRFEAEVYGTQLINDCPQELWETLDANAIAAETGAIAVKLNGPRYWTLDAFGQKLAVADPSMTPESLLTLGERLALPDGWSYRTRVLEEELIVDTTATIATVLQDEFENSYTLPF